MLRTLLLLMKSLSKTETPIFQSVVCSLFPVTIFLTFLTLFVTHLEVLDKPAGSKIDLLGNLSDFYCSNFRRGNARSQSEPITKKISGTRVCQDSGKSNNLMM